MSKRVGLVRLIRNIQSHPANEGQKGRALARALGWQIRKRLIGQPYAYKVWGSMVVNVYPDSTSGSALIYFRGLPDYSEMMFMRRYLREEDRFLDVGANIGVYSLYFCALVCVGSVDAFEPIPSTRVRLEENVSRNRLGDRVCVFPYAVGNDDSYVAMTMTHDTTNHVLSEGEFSKSDVFIVRSVSLDSVVAGHGYALAKMDIEGREWFVLDGMAKMLAEGNPPVLILEINQALHRYGMVENDVAERLSSLGYVLCSYDYHKHRLFYTDSPWRRSRNVLAVHRAAQDHVEGRLARSADASFR